MMGRKTLPEIKAELGLSAGQGNGKPPKRKRAVKPDVELEKKLSKILAELEREVATSRTPKARRPAKR